MGDLVETRVQWNNGLPVAGLIIRDGLQGHGLQQEGLQEQGLQEEVSSHQSFTMAA